MTQVEDLTTLSHVDACLMLQVSDSYAGRGLRATCRVHNLHGMPILAEQESSSGAQFQDDTEVLKLLKPMQATGWALIG